MPNINYCFLKELHDDYKNYECFIETGTLNGDTIFAVESYFNKLYTIEYSEKYYIATKNKYRGDKITFIHGDSSKIFEKLLPEIKSNSIFFLDGHWSSGDTGRSEKDCPLIEEITHINNLFINKGIIIIDDVRLFGLSPKEGYNEDWSYISKDKIINILSKRIGKIYYLDSSYAKNDRMIIHINQL